ncbi:MAG: uracil-DNA glycosylase [Planctomycetota bacterium]
MSPSPDSTAALEPGSATDGADLAAAWIAHLQRSGVRMLPRPIPEHVSQWQSMLSAAATSAPTARSDRPVTQSVTPAGVESQTDARSVSPSIPASVRPATRLEPVAKVVALAESYPMPLPVVDRQSRMEGLAESVQACTRCPELSRCRTQTVFGEGSLEPRFVFFGEGPGADEDRTGRPFVGRAGELLNKMITACRLRREDTYILNTVKCRPPGNRNPDASEIEQCREYYQQQLELLQPEYIVCLGAVAARTLLQTKLSVGRLRQRIHRYRDSKVIATYHPAYLLRNPDAKRAAWADLQMMLRDAGLLT